MEEAAGGWFFLPCRAAGHEYEEGGDRFWKEIHEAAVSLMLFLIALHVAGVVVVS